MPVENVRDETLKEEAKRVLRVEKNRRAIRGRQPAAPARLPARLPGGLSRLPPTRTRSPRPPLLLPLQVDGQEAQLV